jgi:hypothetical protein
MHEANVHYDVTLIIIGSDIKLDEEIALIDPLLELEEIKFP